MPAHKSNHSLARSYLYVVVCSNQWLVVEITGHSGPPNVYIIFRSFLTTSQLPPLPFRPTRPYHNHRACRIPPPDGAHCRPLWDNLATKCGHQRSGIISCFCGLIATGSGPRAPVIVPYQPSNHHHPHIYRYLCLQHRFSPKPLTVDFSMGTDLVVATLRLSGGSMRRKIAWYNVYV